MLVHVPETIQYPGAQLHVCVKLSKMNPYEHFMQLLFVEVREAFTSLHPKTSVQSPPTMLPSLHLVHIYYPMQTLHLSGQLLHVKFLARYDAEGH